MNSPVVYGGNCSDLPVFLQLLIGGIGLGQQNTWELRTGRNIIEHRRKREAKIELFLWIKNEEMLWCSTYIEDFTTIFQFVHVFIENLSGSWLLSVTWGIFPRKSPPSPLYLPERWSEHKLHSCQSVVSGLPSKLQPKNILTAEEEPCPEKYSWVVVICPNIARVIQWRE